MKMDWEKTNVQYEKMKTELRERQKAIVEIYSKLQDDHQTLSTLGLEVTLPESKELHIMNVVNLSPEQLLQLCSVRTSIDKARTPEELAIDMNKIYNLPCNLVATCEHTVAKRKDIIDWFGTLTSHREGISVSKLRSKIQEFNDENEVLYNSLQKVKSEFYQEMNEVIEVLRKMMNDTMALQVRTEELTYELSELNSQNADLRQQIENGVTPKSNTSKYILEELEKELNDEKYKKALIKERLTRTESQLNTSIDKITLLETALEEARSQMWSLEVEIKKSNEQNERLQSEFDSELRKLSESIKENTLHLQEIAKARETLQSEKEDLEKRIGELSQNYNESLLEVKLTMESNIKKLIESEKQCNTEKEEKIKLEHKLLTLTTEFQDLQSRHKEILQKLQEQESELAQTAAYQLELKAAKNELLQATLETTEVMTKLKKQNGDMENVENNLRKARDLEVSLKSDLKAKEECIVELEKTQSILKEKFETCESKMETYEKQLKALKSIVAELQADIGEFEKIEPLDFVKEQHNKLEEISRQSTNLQNNLQKKENEIEQTIQRLKHQEQLLEQKDDIIKMLSKKSDEQSDIIKLLQNDLEIRTKFEDDRLQEIKSKDAEVNALIRDKKLEISHLEKIVLTLEDQINKTDLLRRKDQEKIDILENRLTEYEARQKSNEYNNTRSDLDNLMKLLEDELNCSTEGYHKSEQKYSNSKNSSHRERRNRNMDNFDQLIANDKSIYNSEPETLRTKIVMGNFVKKTYISSKDKNSSNFNRKKAITNMDTQNSVPRLNGPDFSVNCRQPSTEKESIPSYRGGISPSDNYLLRNFLMPNQVSEDKKSKMFNFARHRLN